MGGEGVMDSKDQIKKPGVLPSHHSPVRHILNKTRGLPNDEFIEIFENAKEIPSAYVIMEGDWGGQIYLSCPIELVKCNEKSLGILLDDLDEIAWGCNEGEGKGLFYEIHLPGDGVGGGMGGGLVEEGLWIHDEFKVLNLFDRIEQVLLGDIDKIGKRNDRK